jgi:hypothetical protein
MCCYFSKNNVFNILTLLPFYTLWSLLLAAPRDKKWETASLE